MYVTPLKDGSAKNKPRLFTKFDLGETDRKKLDAYVLDFKLYCHNRCGTLPSYFTFNNSKCGVLEIESGGALKRHTIVMPVTYAFNAFAVPVLIISSYRDVNEVIDNIAVFEHRPIVVLCTEDFNGDSEDWHPRLINFFESLPERFADQFAESMRNKKKHLKEFQELFDAEFKTG